MDNDFDPEFWCCVVVFGVIALIGLFMFLVGGSGAFVSFFEAVRNLFSHF